MPGAPRGGGAPGLPGQGGGPGGAAGGIMLDLRRQKTAKDRLEIEWTFPVYESQSAKETEAGRTTTAEARRALPRDVALQHIRAEDRRPLLVVRECGFCKGTEDALLSRRLDNEKTLIYAKWFRCVKLPNHVLEEDHPFRRLFPDRHPPHLFLCRFDGSDVVAMDGQQTQSQLWAAMEDLIELEYERDPKRATKDYRRLLNEYDVLDGLESETRHQYEEELDENGPRSTRSRKLARKIQQLEARRAKAEAGEEHILDLRLRPLPSEDGEEDRPRRRRG